MIFQSVLFIVVWKWDPKAIAGVQKLIPIQKYHGPSPQQSQIWTDLKTLDIIQLLILYDCKEENEHYTLNQGFSKVGSLGGP